jgi:uncharacterized protein (TIGR00251 family)
MERPIVRLTLRVSPNASRSGIVGRHGAGWKVRVAAPAERGRANDALVALFAGALGVREPDVKVVSGTSGRDKIVEVSGLSAGEVDARLAFAERPR